MKKLELQTEKIRIICIGAIALILPVNFHAVVYLSALLFLVSVPSFFRSREIQTRSSREIFILPLFFLVNACAMIYTSNKAAGWSELGLKFSLLFFPLLFFFAPLSGKQIRRRTGIVFTAACFFMSLLCLVLAISSFLKTGDYSALFYVRLSQFMHPGYFAMYISLAILFTAQRLLDLNLSKTRKLSELFILFWFAFFIAMLQSKAGLIFSLLVLGVFTIVALRRTRKYVFWFSVFAALNFLTLKFIVPPSDTRIDHMAENVRAFDPAKKDTRESSQVRLLIWHSAWEILKENPLTGPGLGDANDALISAYEKDGQQEAFQLRLNAHNQYLQTWLQAGLAGLLLLILALAVPFVNAIRRKDLLAALFFFLIAANGIGESILSAQAGTIFVGFFGSLFLCAGED